MTWGFMSWLFGRQPQAERYERLGAAVSEAVETSEEATHVSQRSSAATGEARTRARQVAEAAAKRIEHTERRRAERERATRERGIADAVEDLIRLPSFGGDDDRGV